LRMTSENQNQIYIKLFANKSQSIEI